MEVEELGELRQLTSGSIITEESNFPINCLHPLRKGWGLKTPALTNDRMLYPSPTHFFTLLSPSHPFSLFPFHIGYARHVRHS